MAKRKVKKRGAPKKKEKATVESPIESAVLNECDTIKIIIEDVPSQIKSEHFETTSSENTLETDMETSVVHHKKFGEIRFKPDVEAVIESIKSIIVEDKPLETPSTVDDIQISVENADVEKFEKLLVETNLEIDVNDLPTERKEDAVINEGLVIENNPPIDGENPHIEEDSLGISDVPGIVSEKETKDLVKEEEMVIDDNKSESESSKEVKFEEDKPKVEGIQPDDDLKVEPDLANIRRSSRIKSIGLLRKKERVLAGSPESSGCPVKVKSRWRRCSEMEMHSNGDTGDSDAATVPVDSPLDQTEQERIDEKLGLSMFTQLAENEYKKKRQPCKETKRMTCDCVLSSEEFDKGEIGCGDDCLNRILHIECGKLCSLGEACSNKRFQRREYADCRIFKTEKKGFGLRATKSIPEETFLMEYVGEVVDHREFSNRAKMYAKNKIPHFYFMSLRSDAIIDATQKGNISRFINHSCNPNAETQMWTVNGEPRIGFFTKRLIQSGEEITFDYCFQRYGREAQKCYCESPNCRGWIGENPDDDSSDEDDDEEDEDEEEEEDEDEEEEDEKKEELIKKETEAKTDTKSSLEKEKSVSGTVEPKPSPDMDMSIMEKPKKEPKKVVRKKREPKLKRNKKKLDSIIAADLGLEQELQRLSITGIKNRAHTLTLSRLMVRAEEWRFKEKLLILIREADEPCRRLFLDYHGLRFLHSWMESIPVSTNNQQKIEIIKTLEKLPIPNKTLLIDSKVLKTIENWNHNPLINKIAETKSENSPQIDSESSSPVVKADPEESTCTPTEDLEGDCALIRQLTRQLLDSWSTLKEVFKIPKKERVEQMKVHEREADRGYREYLGNPESINKMIDRYGRQKIEKVSDRHKKWNNNNCSTSPDPNWLNSHNKGKSNSTNTRLSKEERRRLFAQRVLREEAEAAARAQCPPDDPWLQHEKRCNALGIDPKVYAATDPRTGFPIFYDHVSDSWTPRPPAVYTYPPLCTPPPPLPANFNIPPPPTQSPAGYPYFQVPKLPPPIAGGSFHDVRFAGGGGGGCGPPVGMQETVLSSEQVPGAKPCKDEDGPVILHKKFIMEVSVHLPPKWRSAVDPKKGNRLYFYHLSDRIPTWEPPAWKEEDILREYNQRSPMTDPSSEESEGSFDEESEEEEVNETKEVNMDVNEGDGDENALKLSDEVPSSSNVPRGSPVPQSKDKRSGTTKRREGLVQEIIISPQREYEKAQARKRNKELKLKIRRKKEEKRAEKAAKLIRDKEKKRKRRDKQRVTTSGSSTETDAERRIKDTFKANIAGAIVNQLNHYRKPDCKNGRITNSADFKMLARKLTHFVMLKELKHCQNVDNLTCNDSVKVKAKDFVRKYMAKFGPEYEREKVDLSAS